MDRVQYAPEDFQTKFGSGRLLIADALLVFSYDIVRIVIGYTDGLYITAKFGDQPKFLFEFESFKFPSPVATDTDCYSVAISPRDDIIWCGHDRGCRIFAANGTFVRDVKDLMGAGTGILFENDDVFIADHFGHRLAVCRPDGSIIRSIVLAECGTGRFTHPYGLAADGKGLLFVTEWGNNHVSVYHRDGTFVKLMAPCAEPLGVAVLGNELFVSSICGIQVFEISSGKFLRTFSTSDKRPYGIVFDRAENLVVCDCYNNRIQIFRADGSLVTAFGAFDRVFGCCVARNGTMYVCGAKGRIQAFAFV